MGSDLSECVGLARPDLGSDLSESVVLAWADFISTCRNASDRLSMAELLPGNRVASAVKVLRKWGEGRGNGMNGLGEVEVLSPGILECL